MAETLMPKPPYTPEWAEVHDWFDACHPYERPPLARAFKEFDAPEGIVLVGRPDAHPDTLAGEAVLRLSHNEAVCVAYQILHAAGRLRDHDAAPRYLG